MERADYIKPFQTGLRARNKFPPWNWGGNYVGQRQFDVVSETVWKPNFRINFIIPGDRARFRKWRVVIIDSATSLIIQAD